MSIPWRWIRQDSKDRPGSQFIVAIALPFSPDELQTIQDSLGPAFVVEDIRTAPPEASVVIVPPCSPATIEAVMHVFPGARVLVVDGDFGAADEPVRHSMTARRSLQCDAGPADLAVSVRWAQGRTAA